MRSWWSKYYSRPLKDPLLDTYTLEELIYEYHDIISRKEAEEEEAKSISDKIEDDKLDETLRWAEEDEKMEEELLAQEEMLKATLGDKVSDIKNDQQNNETFDNEQEVLEEEFGLPPEEIDSVFSDF